MGLTIAVYDTKENLLKKYPINDTMLNIDEETGEVYINDTSNGNIKINNIIIEKKLGNISRINMLNDEFRKLLKNNSIILSKILYNGSHCGVIKINDFEILKNEINLVKKNIFQSTKIEIISFLDTLLEVIKIAERYNKPIVFI